LKGGECVELHRCFHQGGGPGRRPRDRLEHQRCRGVEKERERERKKQQERKRVCVRQTEIENP